jgi:hypothetical protein
MSSKFSRIAAAAASLAAVGAMAVSAAPASANPERFNECIAERMPPAFCLPIHGEFNNWHIRGTLVTGGQTIQLSPPEGGNFTGVGLIEIRPFVPVGTPPITGEIDGTAKFAPFTTEIEFPKGSKEHQIASMTLTEVGGVNGGLVSTSPANCPNPIAGESSTCVNLKVPSVQKEEVTVRGPGNGLPSKTESHCETVEPVFLNLSTNLTLLEIIAVGSHFVGSYTVPRFTCSGKYGVGRGEQMTETFSGTGTYDLTTTPQ